MKTNLDSKFKADTTLEEGGVWVTVDTEAGISFRLKRYGGKNASKIREANSRFSKQYAHKIASGNLSVEESEEIAIKAFCSACLIDWKGIKDESDKELPFTFDNSVKLLTDLPELMDTLFRYANRFETYKETETVGNS